MGSAGTKRSDLSGKVKAMSSDSSKYVWEREMLRMRNSSIQCLMSIYYVPDIWVLGKEQEHDRHPRAFVELPDGEENHFTTQTYICNKMASRYEMGQATKLRSRRELSGQRETAAERWRLR